MYILFISAEALNTSYSSNGVPTNAATTTVIGHATSSTRFHPPASPAQRPPYTKQTSPMLPPNQWQLHSLCGIVMDLQPVEFGSGASRLSSVTVARYTPQITSHSIAKRPLQRRSHPSSLPAVLTPLPRLIPSLPAIRPRSSADVPTPSRTEGQSCVICWNCQGMRSSCGLDEWGVRQFETGGGVEGCFLE